MSATELAEQHEIRALYSDHHGWLQGWLRRRLGNTTDATDLAQDVFIRILSRRHAVLAREPRAYLSSIARGLVIDHWRRHELEQAWLATLAALPAPEAPSPESCALILEALVEIDRLLDSLQPPVRRAFLLAQLDGLTCPQIAQELGLSLATAEPRGRSDHAHLHRSNDHRRRWSGPVHERLELFVAAGESRHRRWITRRVRAGRHAPSIHGQYGSTAAKHVR